MLIFPSCLYGIKIPMTYLFQSAKRIHWNSNRNQPKYYFAEIFQNTESPKEV